MIPTVRDPWGVFSCDGECGRDFVCIKPFALAS